MIGLGEDKASGLDRLELLAERDLSGWARHGLSLEGLRADRCRTRRSTPTSTAEQMGASCFSRATQMLPRHVSRIQSSSKAAQVGQPLCPGRRATGRTRCSGYASSRGRSRSPASSPISTHGEAVQGSSSSCTLTALVGAADAQARRRMPDNQGLAVREKRHRDARHRQRTVLIASNHLIHSGTRRRCSLFPSLATWAGYRSAAAAKRRCASFG